MLADAAPNQIQVHRLMVSAEDGIKCRLSGTCLLHNHQFPIHPELLHLTDPLLPDSKGPRTVEPVSTQLFADESKRRGFVMAAVEADSASVAHHRKVLRQQLLRGQERLHFTGESKTRRDQIWKNIAAWKSPVTVHIIVANHRYMAEARAQCVTGVTKLAAALATSLVVIERDAGREISDRKAPSDRRALTEGLHDTGISWDIREPRTEPMLWVADAAAWLWTHPDAAWRARVTPLVGQIIRL